MHREKHSLGFASIHSFRNPLGDWSVFPLAKGGLVHAGPANGCHLEYNPRGARLSKFEKQTNKMLDSFDFHMKSSFIQLSSTY